MSFLTSFPLGLLGDPLKYPLGDVLSRICDLIFPGVPGKARGLDSVNHSAFLPVPWAGLHPTLLPLPPEDPKLLQDVSVVYPVTPPTRGLPRTVSTPPPVQSLEPGKR